MLTVCALPLWIANQISWRLLSAYETRKLTYRWSPSTVSKDQESLHLFIFSFRLKRNCCSSIVILILKSPLTDLFPFALCAHDVRTMCFYFTSSFFSAIIYLYQFPFICCLWNHTDCGLFTTSARNLYL